MEPGSDAGESRQQAWHRVTRYSAEYKQRLMGSPVYVALALVLIAAIVIGIGVLVSDAMANVVGTYTQAIRAWLPE